MSTNAYYLRGQARLQIGGRISRLILSQATRAAHYQARYTSGSIMDSSVTIPLDYETGRNLKLDYHSVCQAAK
jgi:hypothetical protein